MQTYIVYYNINYKSYYQYMKESSHVLVTAENETVARTLAKDIILAKSSKYDHDTLDIYNVAEKT